MLRKVAFGVIALAALSWLADTTLWHLRSSPQDTVTVEQFLETPLKGQRESYDYLGPAQISCARSLYPHGMPPCWYLRRHAQRWTALPRP